MLLHPQAERSGERESEAPSFWLHSGSQGIGGQSVTATVCLSVSGREFFSVMLGQNKRLWWYFIGYVAATALCTLVTVVCFHVHLSLRPNEFFFFKIGSPYPGRVGRRRFEESELPHKGRLTCGWTFDACLEEFVCKNSCYTDIAELR